MINRRTLQITLGVLWLLDGALQLKPPMFTAAFAHQVVAPLATGQPQPLHWLLEQSSAAIAAVPGPADAVLAGVQLALGAGLLCRTTARLALGASIWWALGVWVFGEGAGQLLVPGATALTGAPGAVLLYAVLAAAAWPSGHGLGDGLPPRRFLPACSAGLWGLFALLQLLPAQRSGAAFASDLTAGTATLPEALAHLAAMLAHLAAGAGPTASILTALLFAGIGAAGLFPGTSRIAASSVAVLVALLIWVLPEAFGQMASGFGTDPNSGPLLVVLAIATQGASRRYTPAVADVHSPNARVARAA